VVNERPDGVPWSDRTAQWIGVGAWIVATALIVLLVRSVDATRALSVVRHTRPWWLVGAVMSNLLIQPFGASQWRALLPSGIRVSRWRMLRLFSLTSIANNTTPSLIGHATGAVLLAAEPGVGKAAALSVVALDQIAVGLVKIAIAATAAAMLPLPTWMTSALGGLAIVVLALLLGAIVVALRTKYLDVLREPIRFARGVGFAVCVKLAEAGAIFAVQCAFGLAPSAHRVIVVLAATALGSVIPIAPANIGTYEAASYGAYRYLGMEADAALGIAVVQHACQLLPAVGAGYLMLSLPRLRPRTPPLSV
jgi:uncharacterized membrane protein YbhN (UPF0104 family)